MVRALFISFFIGLILFKPVAQLSWKIWYEVNIDYVAEELCENQDEPELECNGKCYLMKQLAETEAQKQEDQKNQQPTPIVQVKEQPMILSDLVVSINDHCEENTKSVFNYSHNYTSIEVHDFFHPPQNLS